MAIFWKHLKGTNSTSSNNNTWTWIKFTTTPKNGVNQSSQYNPTIWISDKDTTLETERVNLGSIITSNATDQIFQKSVNWIANQSITFGDAAQGQILYRSADTIFCMAASKDSYLQLSKQRADTGNPGTAYINLFDNQTELEHPNEIKIQTPKLAILPYTENAESFIITADKATANFKTLTCSSDITTKNKCEALYFNATSDKRAKDNIMPVQESALEIVNHLPLYTFNYKSQPDQKVVGIIAQDLLDKELDGVSFVDNKNATGTDGDYMTVKESKLVYLLLKAVQEQQKEIDELKKQLESR